MTSHTDYGLPPKWSEYLAERGVPPYVARARGYRYVRAGKPIDGDYAAVWDFGPKYSGLLIPLHGLLAPDPPAVQLRLDNPEDFPDGKGEPRRFMTPARQRNVLVTSPVTRDRLAQPDELIVVAEGVTRVDALAAHDIPAVGILGINNWRTGRPPTAIGDFETLGIKGNRFVIAPDGDVRLNKNVNTAVKRLRTLLLGKGADKVFVMALPGTQGLDDWLAASQFKDRDAVGHAMLELCTDSVEDTTHVPPGGVFGIEDAGPWSCTPAADVRRLLEYAPTRFCVVRGAPGRPWRLLVEQEGGRWSSAKDEAAVGQWHIEAALDWQRRVSEAVIKGELASEHAEACTKWGVLRYPRLKVKLDTERIAAIPETPEARQAVAALLVRHAVKTRERPDDPPSVAEYAKQRRQDSIGHVGQYIERVLRVTGKRRDCVVLDDFIEAVAREAGGKNPKGLIEGLDRKEILALARELVPDLPRAVSRKRQMVWRGVQHVHEDADEDTDDLSERPGCQICGQERDVGELDTWGQCLDRDECDECWRGNGPRPAPSADIGHAQGFEGGRDP